MSKHITLNLNFDMQKSTCSANINTEVQRVLTLSLMDGDYQKQIYNEQLNYQYNFK
jgi:hypothetical protein